MAGVIAANAQDSGTVPPLQPLRTVERVDLDRYLGKWYEIGLYPNRFQEQCVANTTAEYKRKPNGRIEVTNRCTMRDGRVDDAVGEAKLVSDDGRNNKLKVRFAPAFLSWLDKVWGDYWVVDLGAEYEYAIVSEPSRKFLWVLSRTPQLSDANMQRVRVKLSAEGFEFSRLQLTPQAKP